MAGCLAGWLADKIVVNLENFLKLYTRLNIRVLLFNKGMVYL